MDSVRRPFEKDMGGNCEWKPSAAIGYREGGREPVCTEGTGLKDGSRKDDTEVCETGEIAVIVGLVAT